MKKILCFIVLFTFFFSIWGQATWMDRWEGDFDVETQKKKVRNKYINIEKEKYLVGCFPRFVWLWHTETQAGIKQANHLSDALIIKQAFANGIQDLLWYQDFYNFMKTKPSFKEIYGTINWISMIPKFYTEAVYDWRFVGFSAGITNTNFGLTYIGSCRFSCLKS